MQRLLHITDTHLFSNPTAVHAGVIVEARFRATLAAMRPWAQTANALVHTGDLVHDGSEAGYQRLYYALDELALPGLVMPGNHDDRAMMAAVFAGGRLSAERQQSVGDWALIALDTLWDGEVQGRLSAGELAGLDEALAATEARHILLALHHPPVPVGTAWLDAIGLIEPAALLERVMADSRIRGMVLGHVHQAVDATVDGRRYLATPATAAQFMAGAESFALDDGPPAFRWLDLYPDGRIETGVEAVPMEAA